MTRRQLLRALATSAAATALLAAGPMATAQEKPAEKVKDPVCGMNIDPAKARGKSEYQGKTYHFCSDSCKKKFDADPKKYVEPPPPPKR
jgi:YHS domain-containing protein